MRRVEIRKDVRIIAVEYCLIAGFISLVMVAGLIVASSAASVVYSSIGKDLSPACGSMGATGC